MKRVISGATSDGSSLKSKLAEYKDEICTAIQDKFPELSIQSENVIINEFTIDLQNLSVQDLMNVMAENDWSYTWYVKDVPNLADCFRDPDIVNYVISKVGPTFDESHFVYIPKDMTLSSSASELFENVARSISIKSHISYTIEREIISAVFQYELTIKGNFTDPEYFRWMTVKKLFGSNPVFDETGDIERDLDIAYSELESAISQIVPGFNISTDRSYHPRNQFIDVANFNFANRTRQITLKSVDLLKSYASRGVKGLIMHILNRLSGKSTKGVSDILK